MQTIFSLLPFFPLQILILFRFTIQSKRIASENRIVKTIEVEPEQSAIKIEWILREKKKQIKSTRTGSYLAGQTLFDWKDL